MTMIGSCASLCLKKASNVHSIQKLIVTPMLYLGALLYLVSAFINIYILKYLEFSIVLPLTSITYIWTLGLSYLYLKENITKKKAFGIGLIIFGGMLITL